MFHASNVLLISYIDVKLIAITLKGIELITDQV